MNMECTWCYFLLWPSSSSVTVIEQINLKGAGKETSLDMYRNQPEKLLLKKSAFMFGKKSKPVLQVCNQFSNYRRCCPLLQNGAFDKKSISCICCITLTLQWPREKASSCTRPALQGLDKIPCSEASTAPQTPGSVYSPKASRRCTKVLHTSKRGETLLWGSKTEIRLKRVKVTRPSRHDRGFCIQNTWVSTSVTYQPPWWLFNFCFVDVFHLQGEDNNCIYMMELGELSMVCMESG